MDFRERGHLPPPPRRTESLILRPAIDEIQGDEIIADSPIEKLP